MKSLLKIREPVFSELAHLLSIAEATGIFRDGEVDALLDGVLKDYFDGKLPPGHELRVCSDAADDSALGWAYFASSFKASGVWDLWWIGVDPGAQKSGVGGALLNCVEKRIEEKSGRILVIETSSMPALSPARSFYERRGYANCGLIPDFYGSGEAKVTFAKTLVAGARSPGKWLP